MDIEIQSSKKYNLSYLWYALVAIAVAVGVYYLKQHFGEATALVDSKKLRISKVQQGQFEVNVRGIGSLKPNKIVWLSSSVSGRVETVYKKAGAHVEAGEPVIKLNNPQLKQAAITAQSALLQLKAENKASQANLNSQLLDAQTQLARAEIDFEGVKNELDAQKQLRAMGNSTVSDLEYQRSIFNVKRAKLEWQMQERKLDNLNINIAALKEAQLTKQQQLQNELNRALTQVDNLTVKASTSGVLQSMSLELGQDLQIGGSVGKIADPSQLIAHIDIQELQIKDVAIGQTVMVDTRKTLIEGLVSRIDPQVIKGLVTVEVSLIDALPAEARPNLAIEAVIQITNKDNVLFVKKPHYAQEYKTAKVYRLNAGGNLADAVSVEFGQSSVNDIEIKQGLKPGDRIIVSKTDAFAQNAQVFLHN